MQHSPSRAKSPARKSLGLGLSPPSRGGGIRSSAWSASALDAARPTSSAASLYEGGGGAGPRMPRSSQPLRVEPPAEYNAPPRVAETSAPPKPERVLASKLARRPIAAGAGVRPRADALRDYGMLASACRRAGKPATAAQLVFNRGVLYDNMGDSAAALRSYKELLRTSLESADAVGEALACNCIGVTLQLGGAAARAAGHDGADGQLAEAIKYHTQHLAVADVPGKFIAHSNVGLALQAMGNLDEAAAHHQQALRYAIRMSSLAGESIACGHLGMVNRQAPERPPTWPRPSAPSPSASAAAARPPCSATRHLPSARRRTRRRRRRAPSVSCSSLARSTTSTARATPSFSSAASPAPTATGARRTSTTSRRCASPRSTPTSSRRTRRAASSASRRATRSLTRSWRCSSRPQG